MKKRTHCSLQKTDNWVPHEADFWHFVANIHTHFFKLRGKKLNLKFLCVFHLTYNVQGASFLCPRTPQLYHMQTVHPSGHSMTASALSDRINPLNSELNPICYLLALLAHHFLHVSRIRVKSLTLRLLLSYIYMECLFLMFLDHTQRRSTVGRTPLDE